MIKVNNVGTQVAVKHGGLISTIKKNYFIYLLLLPSVVLVTIFYYVPFKGILIAFQDYNIYNPSDSAWVGMANFKSIFKNADTLKALWNTLYVSILTVMICFPAGVIFALLLNEISNSLFKRSVQTLSYLPHFLSWISVISILGSILSKAGPVNDFMVTFFGAERKMYLAEQGLFVPMIVCLTLWKGLGWSSIVYLAAISGVDESLYEAASLDGAGRFRQTLHVTIPAIMPTVVIMLIWQAGSLLNSNFELVYGLQNAYIDFEVIGTIMYKNGIMGGDYQTTTAFGLFQGVVNFVIILMVNWFAKKTTDISIM